MTGRDVNEKHWKVLKISRSEPSELKIKEKSRTYSSEECKRLVDSIQGLKCVVFDCYGILGFIKSLHTYYILLITKRREVGKICGHPIYAVSEYRTIPICRSNRWKYIYNSTKETRYKIQLSSWPKMSFMFLCNPIM
ncbi:Phosphoinositide phosphatase SAC1 [Bienertia sinuspersici]